jgi:hypothetical protein
MSTKKKTTPIDPGMFYQAPVKVNGKTVTIELPLNAAEYFGLDGPVVYWAPVGGVIQLSGKQPLMVIPMLCANAGQFVPQRAAGDAHEQPAPMAELLAHVQPARRPRRAAAPLTPAPMPAPPVIAWEDWVEDANQRH